jgi:recombination protein RecR
MDRLPAPLREIVGHFARLPGLGPKSALRLAMTLLKWPESETRRLGHAIHTLRDSLTLCGRCGAPADADPCAICADPERQNDLLCVVSEWDSLLALEGGGFFRGRYCILGGLLSAADNPTEHLDLERLFARLDGQGVREVVLALGATIEAEHTAAFVRNVVNSRFPDVRVSRLAQGIPLGAEVKFMDRETLRQSLQHRQQF